MRTIDTLDTADDWDDRDALPPGWRLEPMAFEPASGAWCAFAVGPIPATHATRRLMGCGPDEETAVRDLLTKLQHGQPRS